MAPLCNSGSRSCPQPAPYGCVFFSLFSPSVRFSVGQLTAKIRVYPIGNMCGRRGVVERTAKIWANRIPACLQRSIFKERKYVFAGLENHLKRTQNFKKLATFRRSPPERKRKSKWTTSTHPKFGPSISREPISREKLGPGPGTQTPVSEDYTSQATTGHKTKAMRQFSGSYSKKLS